MIEIGGYLLGVPNVEHILIWPGSCSTLFLEDEVRREIKHTVHSSICFFIQLNYQTHALNLGERHPRSLVAVLSTHPQVRVVDVSQRGMSLISTLRGTLNSARLIGSALKSNLFQIS